MQLMFASITVYCSFLLCDKYRYPDPVTVSTHEAGMPVTLSVPHACTHLDAVWQGERCYTYTTAVRRYLGEPCQQTAAGLSDSFLPGSLPLFTSAAPPTA